jgi:hypothetical protein
VLGEFREAWATKPAATQEQVEKSNLELSNRVEYLENIVRDLQTASGLRIGSSKPEG